MTTKKFSMIRDAQAVASVGAPEHYETLKEIQQKLGKSIAETVEVFEGFKGKITPRDYDVWIHQVVSAARNLPGVNLNRRASFNDMLGQVLENDPKFVYHPDLLKHVSDAVWRRYQSTRDHLKVQNVLKAREEEELNVNKPPLPEETDEFEPSRSNYDGDDMSGEEDMSYGDDMPTDDMSGDEIPRDEVGFDDVEGGEDMGDDVPPMEPPYEEGTPEYDAWMAGFQAAMDAEQGEEGMDDVEGDVDVEQMDGVDYEGGETDPEMTDDLPEELPMDDDMPAEEMPAEELPEDLPPEENEEKDVFMGRDIHALRARRNAVLSNDPKADVTLFDALIKKYEKAMSKVKAVASQHEENEEQTAQHSPAHYINRGYLAAKAEYHHGRKTEAPKDPSAARHWERGYEEFMRDTEGQRDLARRGAEDEEKVMTVKNVLTQPKDSLNQALKGVEEEGAAAFDDLQMPKNKYPNNSLAQKAWAKGFKNAVKAAFGFDQKPAEPKKRKKK